MTYIVEKIGVALLKAAGWRSYPKGGGVSTAGKGATRIFRKF